MYKPNPGGKNGIWTILKNHEKEIFLPNWGHQELIGG
jgi:hypothetical protein